MSKKKPDLGAVTGVTADPVCVPLACSRQGVPYAHVSNVIRALSDKRVLPRLVWCELSMRPMLDGREMTDSDATALAYWLEQTYSLRVGTALVHEGSLYLAHTQSRHPIREWLYGLKWDGVQRMSNLCTTYLGCESREVYTAYSRWWMIGSVHRAIEPGCQHDYALILYSATQGKRKSSAAVKLAVQREWFSDQQMPWDDAKACAEQIAGVWIYELGELAGVSKADRQRVKATISQRSDRLRASYARLSQTTHRSVSFIGSTNDRHCLSDPTGARRFWVADVVREADIDALERDAPQLWAEAVHAYLAGEKHWPDSNEADELAEHAMEYSEEDPWRPLVLEWAAGRKEFALSDCMGAALKMDIDRFAIGSSRRVTDILSAAGYHSHQIRLGQDRRRFWARPVAKPDAVKEKEPGPFDDLKEVAYRRATDAP